MTCNVAAAIGLSIDALPRCLSYLQGPYPYSRRLLPIRDQIVFDWVLALGSTREAAAVLDLPQSSVSRRYRALAQQFSLPVRRQSNIFTLAGDTLIYQRLRELSQLFRLCKHRYRWAWQPRLDHLSAACGPIGDQAFRLELSHDHWQNREHFRELRILDTWFELCDPSAPGWAAVLPLRLWLVPPRTHPSILRSQPSIAAQWAQLAPLQIAGLNLPQSLISQLRGDGFELEATAPRGDGLSLAVGRCDSSCIPLPYPAHAGWRLPLELDGLSFNPALLAQATAPLATL